MKTLQLKDAKAGFSAVVEAAERGESTTITKHGKPAAVVVPIAEAHRLLERPKRSFAELLMGIPVDIEFERDQTPMREIDL